jgi:hypothetical protein
MNEIAKIGYFTLGLILGGMIMWMVDYFVYFEYFKAILRICGAPCAN